MVRIPRSVRPMHSRRGSSPLWAASDLNQLSGVVERGCRFAEIDAVLRNVRFFFLGIPLKSRYPLHIGGVWDDVNIELQYNLVGIWLSAGERAPRVPGDRNF